MRLYLLDTNIVTHAIKGHPAVTQHLQKTSSRVLRVSVITYAELMYGLARRPEAKHLHKTVKTFLQMIEALPFDEYTAEVYGNLRASLEANGYNLSPLDMQIAAHAISIHAILVTNDQAFRKVGIPVEDWT